MQKVFTHFVSHFLQVIWYYRAIFFANLVIIIIGATAITLVEKLPFGDALYFTFVTGLTIGYGEIVVKTTIGRCVAIFIGLVGTIFSGLVIAAAVEAVKKTYHRQ